MNNSKKIIYIDQLNEVIDIQYGYIDLFTAKFRNNEVCSRILPIGRITENNKIFCFSENLKPGNKELINYYLYALVGKNAKLKRYDLKEYFADSKNISKNAKSITDWITLLFENVNKYAKSYGSAKCIYYNTEISIKQNEIFTSDELLWIKKTPEVKFNYYHSNFTVNDDFTYMPVSPKNQVIALNDCCLKPVNTLHLLENSGLDSVEKLYKEISKQAKLIIDNHYNHIEEKISYYQKQKKNIFNATIKQAENVMSKSFVADNDMDLIETEDKNILKALKTVGKEYGLNIKKTDKNIEYFDTVSEYINNIALSNNVNIREVNLTDGWWKNDGLPFLSFFKDSETACAVISEYNHYALINPQNGSKLKVNKENSGNIYNKAFTLHPVLKNEKISYKEIIKLILLSGKRDIFMLILLSLITAIFALVTPILTERIINRGIIYTDIDYILQVLITLIITGVIIALFDTLKSFAILRFESKNNIFLQSAVIDRLYKLPMKFYRNYSAGDLAMRALGIEKIQQLLTGANLNALLGGAFSFVSLLLMFYYSVNLAVLGLGMAVVIGAFDIFFSLRQLKYIQKSMDIYGESTGIAYQVCAGLPMLKIMDKEKQGFGKWGNIFCKSCLNSYKIQKLEQAELISEISVDSLIQLLIFGAIAWMLKGNIEIGVFLAFLTAFGLFSSGIKNLTSVVSTILPVKSYYNRLRPILEEVPVNHSNRITSIKLNGKIEVQNVSFKYSEKSPEIINSISMNINPEEFVAIVGPSGAGKSTLFRLLLGIETPTSGAIFYDNMGLSYFNLREFRRKIGVVSQKAQLMPGSILENITGSGQYSETEAWEAARLAGLEEDINSFPMKMHTMVSEDSSIFSGGQKQRIIIARALIRKPKIILLDEATSALDNKTQDIIKRSLEQLKATRIVIAHRLSTIQHADKIYVMDKGSIVETGKFEELIERKGIFYRIANRQLV